MSPSDEIDDMEPVTSAGSALDEAAPPAQAEAAPASSSAATGANEADDADLLKVVRDVVDKTKPVVAVASPAESEEAGDDAGEKVSRKEADDENYSDVPFHKHPRFQHLLKRMKESETDAGRYRNVERFMSDNGLQAEEAAEALLIAGLMKTNPAEAWKRMQPAVQKLLQAAGEVLPEDMMRRVQAGELTHSAAIEIARAKAQVQSIQTQQTFAQQQAERQRQMEQHNSLASAAVSWEADRRLKDPNFDAKLPSLQEKILWLQHTEGRPTTQEGVKDQLARAYKAVNAQLAPPPAPQAAAPRQVIPVTGGQVAGNTRPEPSSVRDIVRSVVARRAG